MYLKPSPPYEGSPLYRVYVIMCVKQRRVLQNAKNVLFLKPLIFSSILLGLVGEVLSMTTMIARAPFLCSYYPGNFYYM